MAVSVHQPRHEQLRAVADDAGTGIFGRDCGERSRFPDGAVRNHNSVGLDHTRCSEARIGDYICAAFQWSLRVPTVSATLAEMTPVILCIARSPDHPSPCRHCLAESEIGTPLLLSSYHFGRPHGVYWTPSPIFLHAELCERFERADIVPEIVRHRLVSVRAYDADDMCIYDLGDVCDGTDVERLLERALSGRPTDYVNIHTARPGSFLCRVERV
jgi:hypothetical protein